MKAVSFNVVMDNEAKATACKLEIETAIAAFAQWTPSIPGDGIWSGAWMPMNENGKYYVSFSRRLINDDRASLKAAVMAILNHPDYIAHIITAPVFTSHECFMHDNSASCTNEVAF
jgi:hypothetical protein